MILNLRLLRLCTIVCSKSVDFHFQWCGSTLHQKLVSVDIFFKVNDVVQVRHLITFLQRGALLSLFWKHVELKTKVSVLFKQAFKEFFLHSPFLIFLLSYALKIPLLWFQKFQKVSVINTYG